MQFLVSIFVFLSFLSLGTTQTWSSSDNNSVSAIIILKEINFNIIKRDHLLVVVCMIVNSFDLLITRFILGSQAFVMLVMYFVVLLIFQFD